MRLPTVKSGLPNGSKSSTALQKKCQRLPIRSSSEKSTNSRKIGFTRGSLVVDGYPHFLEIYFVLQYIIIILYYTKYRLLLLNHIHSFTQKILLPWPLRGKRFKSTICASWFLEANLVIISICNHVGAPNFWTSERCHLSNFKASQ